ncbi:Asp-tRNA(Asn)/Glu-tRNA(Gln) amidotransferase subunit GatC [soil metagenome]
MSITDADMAHLKTLARMNLSEPETQGLKDDLNRILEAFETLRALPTEGVEELARPVDLYNVFRADDAHTPLSHETALKLAVESEDGFFKVPRTVDTGE